VRTGTFSAQSAHFRKVVSDLPFVSQLDIATLMVQSSAADMGGLLL
jgi:hypothetical protein